MMSNWYDASPRAKKIMCMLTTRSLVPCYLTIGGLNVMSLQNFSGVKKIVLFIFLLSSKNFKRINNFTDSRDVFSGPSYISLVLHHLTIAKMK